MIQYLSYKLLQLIIHCVPKKACYAFARWLARMQCKISFKDRLAVKRNLNKILGDCKDIDQKVEQVFLNFSQYLVDFFLMYRIDDRFIQKYVRFENKKYFDEAFAKNKGVIILTAHVGNWEMAGAVMAKVAEPLTVIALAHKDKFVNNLFNKQRQAHGVKVVTPNVAVRHCIGALRKKKIVALLGDRDFGSFGERVDFFGQETLIPKGAAFFSYKTGALIVPGFLVPEGDGKYVVRMYPAIEPQSDKDEEQEIRSIVKQSVSVMEQEIRRDPTYWMMFRDFGVER